MKTLLLYLALVGLPLLGLTGILYLGERLVPPRGVGGTWELTLDSRAEATTACVRREDHSGHAELVMLQSGSRLEMRFSDEAQTRMAGTIHADSIQGRARGAGPPACAGEGRLRLQARVQQEGDGLRMTGQLTATHCACDPVSFTAARKQMQED